MNAAVNTVATATPAPISALPYPLAGPWTTATSSANSAIPWGSDNAPAVRLERSNRQALRFELELGLQRRYGRVHLPRAARPAIARTSPDRAGALHSW